MFAKRFIENIAKKAGLPELKPGDIEAILDTFGSQWTWEDIVQGNDEALYCLKQVVRSHLTKREASMKTLVGLSVVDNPTTAAKKNDEPGKGMTDSEYTKLVNDTMKASIDAQRQLDDLKKQLKPFADAGKKLGMSGRFQTWMKKLGEQVLHLEDVVVSVRDVAAVEKMDISYYKRVVAAMVEAEPAMKKILDESEATMKTLVKGYQKVQAWDEYDEEDKRKKAPFEVKLAQVKLSFSDESSGVVQVPFSANRHLQASMAIEAYQNKYGSWDFLQKVLRGLRTMSSAAADWIRKMVETVTEPFFRDSINGLSRVVKDIEHAAS